MGFERHNEFTVRFKFRVLETCSIGHSLPVSSSKHFWALQGIFFASFAARKNSKRTGSGKISFTTVYSSSAARSLPLANLQEVIAQISTYF